MIRRLNAKAKVSRPFQTVYIITIWKGIEIVFQLEVHIENGKKNVPYPFNLGIEGALLNYIIRYQ